MSLVPTVIESTGKGEAAYDIYSRLLKERIVFISGEIDDDMASSVIPSRPCIMAQAIARLSKP